MATLGQLLCSLLIFILLVTGLGVLGLWWFNLSLVYAAAGPFAAFLIFYIGLPILFMNSSNIQRYFVYLASARKPPPEFDFSDTESAGLSGCRSFFLFLNEGTEYIGIWHLLPHSLINEASSKSRHDNFWKTSLQSSGKSIVIYFHGNTGTRALEHRKELYWILQNLDCHVIAPDYRGFGDSSPCSTSEQTTVEDGLLVYSWILDLVGPNHATTKVFIWGHSLGTGIASHVVAKLQNAGTPPAGLILESPFTNLGEALRHNKKAILYKNLPKFKYLFVRPLHLSGIAYQTDHHIQNIFTPILILHARDDETVPFSLGEKLFQQGKGQRPRQAHPIHFKSFPKGHGHKLIHTSPELPFLITGFFHATSTTNWSNFNCDCCPTTVVV